MGHHVGIQVNVGSMNRMDQDVRLNTESGATFQIWIYCSKNTFSVFDLHPYDHCHTDLPGLPEIVAILMKKMM